MWEKSAVCRNVSKWLVSGVWRPSLSSWVWQERIKASGSLLANSTVHAIERCFKAVFQPDHQPFGARLGIAIQAGLAFLVGRLFGGVAPQGRCAMCRKWLRKTERWCESIPDGLPPAPAEWFWSVFFRRLDVLRSQRPPLQVTPQLGATLFERVGSEIQHPLLQQQLAVGLQVPLDVGAARFVQPAMQNNPLWFELTHATCCCGLDSTQPSRRSRASQAPSPLFLWPCQISGMKLALGASWSIRANSWTQSISPSWICRPSPSTPFASARCRCAVKGRIALRKALKEALRWVQASLEWDASRQTRMPVSCRTPG